MNKPIGLCKNGGGGDFNVYFNLDPSVIRCKPNLQFLQVFNKY